MNESSSALAGGTLKRSRIVAPILITAVGVGWLLTAHGVLPGVQWAWVLGLAVLGALVLFLGIDKASIVVGPTLITASVLSMLRQSGWITVDTEIPVLTIVVGALWTAASLLPLAAPSWFLEDPHRTLPLPAVANPPKPRD
jgi:hypothetical protein